MSIRARLSVAFILLLVLSISTATFISQLHTQQQQAVSSYRNDQLTFHDFEHANELFNQWFMTIDLFLLDRTLYLATIIHKQTQQLDRIINTQLMKEAPIYGQVMNKHLKTVKNLLGQLTSDNADESHLLTQQYFEERATVSKELVSLQTEINKNLTAGEQQRTLIKNTTEQYTIFLTLGFIASLIAIFSWLNSSIASPTLKLVKQARLCHQKLYFQPTQCSKNLPEAFTLSQTINHLVDRLTDMRMRLVIEKHQHKNATETFHALTNTNVNAILIVQSSGIIQFMNNATNRLFGLPLQEQEQIELEELIPSLTVAHLAKLNSDTHGHCLAIRRDGGALTLNISSTRFDNDSPKYILTLSLATSHTSSKPIKAKASQ